MFDYESIAIAYLSWLEDYKTLLFRASNKVALACNSSFDTKLWTFYDFVIHFFLVFCKVYEIRMLTPQVTSMWRSNASNCLRYSHFTIPRPRS